MYDAGWKNIVNLDVSVSYLLSCRPRLIKEYSRILIEQMREKHASREGMTWLEMDVLDLKFDADEFDLVLDKGQSR